MGSVHHAFMHELMIVICKHVPVCLQACCTSTYVCMLVCSFAYCMQFGIMYWYMYTYVFML